MSTAVKDLQGAKEAIVAKLTKQGIKDNEHLGHPGHAAVRVGRTLTIPQ